MSGDLPIMFRWDGTVMIPLSAYQAERAAKVYRPGGHYALIEHEDRTDKSHRHFFAVLKEMWLSLPEKYQREPWAESPEHLRKYALIRTGFYSVVVQVCRSAAEAKRWVAFIKTVDEYSIVLVRGRVISRYSALSQSHTGMPNRREFQDSKQKVLDFVADLLELPADAEQRKDAAA